MTATERFLRYVKFNTKSDENSNTTPSTESQFSLARQLGNELSALGLEQVTVTDKCYVYGFLPATKGQEDKATIGLIAHMDTSPDVSGEGVSPNIVCYQGGDIALGNGEILSPKEYPSLNKYLGEDLIVTNGQTLLGADDKAGIAEIISAVEYLILNPQIPHGRIAVGFTPDEEIGRGADFFDIGFFGAKFAYTVDGGELGEIEYENFNGASVKIVVNGVNIHPGSAKNKMKNAVLLANELISMLPPSETPAHTEGYEGFYHVTDIEGNESKTELQMIIRDHDLIKFSKRKKFVRSIVEFLNAKYGENTFVAEIKDSYYNMREKIEPHMYIVDRAKEAMRECGVEPQVIAIRGGTDGARLSFEGLPCPNLSTGGVNFHSKYEYISVRAIEKMVEVLVKIITK